MLKTSQVVDCSYSFAVRMVSIICNYKFNGQAWFGSWPSALGDCSGFIQECEEFQKQGDGIQS